jgi:NAD-dependent dihydropyrimidine dehydrogenase PreA subunit
MATTIRRSCTSIPGECIDCGACEPECPVEAIYADSAVPADQQKYVEINAEYFKDK